MKYHSMIPELTISDIEITKDFYLNKMCIRDSSIGSGVTYNDALDPLALQLAFVGIILLMAHGLSVGLVAIHPILSNIPEFALSLIHI